MVKKILVTGGAGFIGSHFVEHIIKKTDWNVAVIDCLTYASMGLERLRGIDLFGDNKKRLSIFNADFSQELSEGIIKEIGEVDYIVHIGAETHVDRSIANPRLFVKANVVGTMEMLEYARKHQKNLKAFVYFSTDEVFGPAPEGVFFKEWDRYNAGNPYSAAKAGGEELCVAYANTYQIPIVITHTMNVFGEMQHPEKFIPKVIKMCLAGDKVLIHSNKSKTKPGSRSWIHARNVAAAILFLLENVITKSEWKNGDKYNIVGEIEIDNLSMAQKIAKILNKELKYEMVDFHSTRPGHDLRYALNGEKMKRLGWKIPVEFEESFEKTIKWTIHPDNKKWLDYEYIN